MCLAQGHNAVTPVRHETVALRSRVKHSTTALPLMRLHLCAGLSEPLLPTDALRTEILCAGFYAVSMYSLVLSLEELIENSRFVSFDIKFTRQGFENAC